MGKTRGPYEAEYPVGSSVRIAGKERLSRFAQEWKLHHPLAPEQLDYADRPARVKEVSFYHGADELYVLDGIPGIWHEENLVPT
jgi:hypothetical protein